MSWNVEIYGGRNNKIDIDEELINDIEYQLNNFPRKNQKEINSWTVWGEKPLDTEDGNSTV